MATDKKQPIQNGGKPSGGTKGGTTNEQRKQMGRNLARVAQQGK
jgi:hypothetical protein